MRHTGLDGIEVTRDFIVHRVQPLKRRTGFTWYFTSKNDGNRELTMEHSEEEVIARLGKLFADKSFLENDHPRCYCMEYPRPEVRVIELHGILSSMS